MGLIEAPEIKLARRIIAKHSIKLPYKLSNIVKLYADIIFIPIPIPCVDGVSLNLNIPGKKPKIIINSNLPLERKLFTLAHQFGHIIIPWHQGTIVDDVFNQSYKDFYYAQLEQEANRFAIELIMPKDWILNRYKQNSTNLATLHMEIAIKARVSGLVAATKLIEILPPQIIYTAEENGKVIHSGKTEKTYAFTQDKGTIISENFYPYIQNYSSHQIGTIIYHWWTLSPKIEIHFQDKRTSREIINKIMHEIQPPEGISTLKSKIKSIIGYTFIIAKSEKEYSKESLHSAIIYTLQRPQFSAFTSHPDFEAFVKTRVNDFFKSTEPETLNP